MSSLVIAAGLKCHGVLSVRKLRHIVAILSLLLFIELSGAAGLAQLPDWATRAGGTESDEGRDIAVDGAGNGYVAGQFRDTATFGLDETNETDLTSGGFGDIFVAKLESRNVNTLDVDGNEQADALTDGILILRFLFQFEGDALIAGALAPDCTRCTAEEINGYLLGLRSEAMSIDQEQPVIDTSAGFTIAIGGNSDQKLAQAVTAERTGMLTEVRFPIACNGELLVEIQAVTGGKPNDIVMTSQVIPGGSIPAPAPSTFRSLVLLSPVFFQEEQSFAIVLSNSSGSCGVVPGPIGNLYEGGDGFFDSRPNPPGVWVPLSGERPDLPFQTVMNDGWLLDVDGNGIADALTDGILILRYLFSFRGEALVGGGVVANDCARCTADTIEGFLSGE